MFQKLFNGRRKVGFLLLASLMFISLGEPAKVQGVLICNDKNALVEGAASEAAFSLLEAEIARITGEALKEFFLLNAETMKAEAAELRGQGAFAVAHYDKALEHLRNVMSLTDQVEMVHSSILSFVQRVGIRPGLNDALRKIDIEALYAKWVATGVVPPLDPATWNGLVRSLKAGGFEGPLRAIHSNIATYKQLVADLYDLLLIARPLIAAGKFVENVRQGKLRDLTYKASQVLNVSLSGLWMAQVYALTIGEAYRALKVVGSRGVSLQKSLDSMGVTLLSY